MIEVYHPNHFLNISMHLLRLLQIWDGRLKLRNRKEFPVAFVGRLAYLSGYVADEMENEIDFPDLVLIKYALFNAGYFRKEKSTLWLTQMGHEMVDKRDWDKFEADLRRVSPYLFTRPEPPYARYKYVPAPLMLLHPDEVNFPAPENEYMKGPEWIEWITKGRQEYLDSRGD